MMERHFPEVIKKAGEWRFRCSCGDEGLARPTRRMAKADQDEHLQAVSPVPPGEQCRMPRQHRMQPWERCGLCANQLDLFDLEEITTVKETSR